MCLGTRYRPGAAVVLGWSRAVSRISASSLVVTGEGRLDQQTLLGKLPDTIRKIAPDGAVIARGIASFSSDELRVMAGRGTDEAREQLGERFRRPAIHRDQLVML